MRATAEEVVTKLFGALGYGVILSPAVKANNHGRAAVVTIGRRGEVHDKNIEGGTEEQY